MLLPVQHLYRQQEIECCNELHFPYYLWQNIFSAFTGNFKTCLVGHHSSWICSSEIKYSEFINSCENSYQVLISRKKIFSLFPPPPQGNKLLCQNVEEFRN